MQDASASTANLSIDPDYGSINGIRSYPDYPVPSSMTSTATYVVQMAKTTIIDTKIGTDTVEVTYKSVAAHTLTSNPPQDSVSIYKMVYKIVDGVFRLVGRVDGKVVPRQVIEEHYEFGEMQPIENDVNGGTSMTVLGPTAAITVALPGSAVWETHNTTTFADLTNCTYTANSLPDTPAV